MQLDPSGLAEPEAFCQRMTADAAVEEGLADESAGT